MMLALQCQVDTFCCLTISSDWLTRHCCYKGTICKYHRQLYLQIHLSGVTVVRVAGGVGRLYVTHVAPGRGATLTSQ